MRSINRVLMTGNLTRDPELKEMSGDNKLCKLRIANNDSVKNAAGEWEDRPNFFDVDVWGAQAGPCAQYLHKGSPVMIDGRLKWREWTDDNGNKRQSISIRADSVQFLPSKDGRPENRDRPREETAPEGRFVPAGETERFGGDDDIPF